MTRGCMSRRAWLTGAVGAALLPWSPASAQTYPSKPVQVVVPFPAGGPTDTIARRVAEKLQQSLGKPVIVENRPGGGTLIGAEAVVRSEPDGHTILCGTSSTFALAPNLYKKRNFNPKTTLVPVVLAAEAPLVLVISGKINAGNLAEFVAYGKANKSQLGFASVGAGTVPHLFGELMKTATGMDMQHVPYKGSAPAMTDLIAGHVHMIFDQMGFVSPFVHAGQVKAMAITATKRYPELPGTPTIEEAGFPLLARTIWTGFAVPAGTPSQVVQILNDEINKALRDPELKKALEQTGTFVVGGSPERFRQTWYADEEFWRGAVAEANVQMD
jgi:tripartite-type tricarboxylate transporter receptor subunit TctC